MEIVGKFMKLATVFLVATIVFGIIYAETLRQFVTYKFNNAFGMLAGVSAAYDFSWLFMLKLVLVAVQVYAIYSFAKGRIRPVIAAGPAALAGVFAGEMLNSFSQYPTS